MSGVFIVDFEQVNISWDILKLSERDLDYFHTCGRALQTGWGLNIGKFKTKKKQKKKQQQKKKTQDFR